MSWVTLLIVFGATMSIFLIVIAGMAVGVMFGRKQISGSCGGLAAKMGDDGQASCSLCSNPDQACRELARQAALKRQANGAAGTIASATSCDHDHDHNHDHDSHVASK